MNEMTVVDTVFRNNSAYEGTAIFCSGAVGRIVLSRCSLTEGHTENSGGSMHLQGSIDTIGEFHRDETPEFRSLIFVHIEMQGCLWANNTSSISGGAVSMIGSVGHVIMRNTTFYNNSASSGGAVYIDSYNHTVYTEGESS